MAALALASFVADTTVAQTVLQMPKSKKANITANAGNVKAESNAAAVQRLIKDYRSPWLLASAAERVAYQNYVQATGQRPSMQKPLLSPFGPEDDTEYKFTGFNIQAGLADDGTTATGGLVNFNLEPFACDTVSSDNGVSPYSYMAKGRLYCFLPVMDGSGKYTSVTRTVYDATTLERLSQKTFEYNHDNTDYLPYLLTYDDQQDIVYTISFKDVRTDLYTETRYYLNILDTTQCKLQRVGYLGSWRSDRNIGNYNPKAFVAGYGTLYVHLSDDKVYIGQINPVTCETKVIGSTKMPTLYIYGLQPMVYDSSMGHLLVNHYDMGNGTQYYKVSPFVPYGSKEDTCKTVLVENTPTGFTYFYQRPTAGYYEYELADVTDLAATSAAGSTDINVSFTVPSADRNGNKIEIPDWTTDNVRVYVYVDGNYVTPGDMPSSVRMGDRVECTLTGQTAGMHVVTVNVSPYYTSVAQVRAGITTVCGYDAPADVINPTLAIAGGKATISWQAPTQGRYADFGSTFDAQDITYSVVRDCDGTVVAKDITATTAVDAALPEYIQTYTYTIYASSHGTANLGTQTNAVSAGSYMRMPYTNTFSASSDLDGWTIINANDDGSWLTWRWNSFSYKMNSSANGAGCDDWFISPAFNLKADSLYILSYQYGMGYDNETASLRTTLGNGATAEAQTITLDDMDKMHTGSARLKRIFYRPTAAGLYNFGLYNYGVGSSYIEIDSVVFKAVAPVSAPGKVRSVQFTPDANGALGATISFTLPATDIDGNGLSSLSKVTIYDAEGNELACKTGVAPGAAVSMAVKAVKGFNTYSIVAANDKGGGWPVDVTRYVGLDVPTMATNLKARWGEDKNIVVLSWDNATQGQNGGYVDAANFTYNLYKYDSMTASYTKLGETTGESEIEVQMMDLPDAQDQYIFGLTVSNEEGESGYARAGIILGNPYTLPYTEAFTGEGVTHAPYVLDKGINNQTWNIDGGYYNTKIQPVNNDGAQLLMYNKALGEASGLFVSPIIDFTSTQKPMFHVWAHHSGAIPETAYLGVKATIDGSNDYIEVAPKQTVDGNNGWQEHIFDLSALNGKKAQIALEAYVPNPSVRVFADNWTIKEATGNDLAVTGISQPYNPVAGDVANVKVTVVNKGATTAQGYSVLFNVNDATIAEEEASEPLAPGAAKTYTFTLPLTAAAKNVMYNAQVMYDDDNADNNLSSDVEVDARQLDLAAPTNLTVEGDDLLSWLAPEVPATRTETLTFEDVPVFTTDNINGWTTYDGDGNLSLTFVQYYDNYWPYAYQPMAWMTWSAKEAGCPDAAMWTPYQGDNCLIHFGNFGADADGRIDNDPDNDWFISPEIAGGSELSFMTLSNETTSSVEILTSSTDNKPESFTNKVATVTYSAAASWQEVKVTLPADAKYVAIRTVLDGFGIMIDDITYTTTVAPVLKGYNVYRDNQVEGFVTDANATATARASYAVSAVYDMGESTLSNMVVTAIAGINAVNANVSSGNGMITVTGAQGAKVCVYTASGQLVAGGTAGATERYSVSKGVYIVDINNKPYKLIVR